MEEKNLLDQLKAVHGVLKGGRDQFLGSGVTKVSGYVCGHYTSVQTFNLRVTSVGCGAKIPCTPSNYNRLSRSLLDLNQRSFLDNMEDWYDSCVSCTACAYPYMPSICDMQSYLLDKNSFIEFVLGINLCSVSFGRLIY